MVRTVPICAKMRKSGPSLIEPQVDVCLQELGCLNDAEAAAVDGNIVVPGVAPFGLAEMVVVALALLVGVADQIFCVFFAKAELPHYLAHLRVIVAEHEDFDGVVVVFEDFLRAAADDDE